MRKMGLVKDDWELSPSDAPPWESLSENDRDDLDFRRAIYSAQIDNMDQNVGRLIEKLRKMGIYDNTLIMFLSDNGCSAEPETEMFGYKFRDNRIENFRQLRKQSDRSSSQGLAWANASAFYPGLISRHGMRRRSFPVIAKPTLGPCIV